MRPAPVAAGFQRPRPGSASRAAKPGSSADAKCDRLSAIPLAVTYLTNSRREGCILLPLVIVASSAWRSLIRARSTLALRGSGQLGDGRGARPGCDQRRPLLGAERYERGQERLRAALGAFGDDGGARVAAHQLVVHQVVVAEEQRARRAVGNDACERPQHVLWCRGEGNRLDQDEPGVDRIGSERLGQNAE